MSYKAVLFDMDGTLLNTLEDLANAGNQTLKKLGFPIHNIEDYRFFVGKGAASLAKVILPTEKQDESTVQTCLEMFLNEYDKHWMDNTKLYPGISQMLDQLTEMGIRMSIFSNKPHPLTMKCANAFLSKWNFEKIYGQSAETPRKPDPKGALKIAEEMNLPTESFAYLGDTSTDMKTANAAKMFPVGVLWGFRPKEELIEAGSKALLENPLELFKFI